MTLPILNGNHLWIMVARRLEEKLGIHYAGLLHKYVFILCITCCYILSCTVV